jgi:hypothetical protein
MENELNEIETSEARDQDDVVVEEHLTVEIPTDIQAGRFSTSWGCQFA